MADLDPQQKIALIVENLQEILHLDIIENVIVNENRALCTYWGTAPTGKPHCAYFVPMIKVAQFLRAGCRVKILLADIHGFLDSLNTPIELVKYRADYYRFVISALLRAVGVSLDKLEFVVGSSYQLSADYILDFYRLSHIVTGHEAKKAGAEVVKQVDNAPLSGLIYPLLQSLDEQYLEVDAQFGGVDQRKIFTFAAEVLPKIGYRKRAHLMNPMVPGLTGGKMSASEPNSKIDILDTEDLVRKKVNKAHAVPRQVEGNAVISFVEYVLLPVSALQSQAGEPRFEVEQQEEEKEPIIYSDIHLLKEDYKADKLTPRLLKAAVAKALVDLLRPVQAEFQASEKWQEVERLAYPPTEPVKKKGKSKDLGSQFPRAVKAKHDGSVEGSEGAKVGVSTDAEEAMSKVDINGTP